MTKGTATVTPVRVPDGNGDNTDLLAEILTAQKAMAEDMKGRFDEIGQRLDLLEGRTESIEAIEERTKNIEETVEDIRSMIVKGGSISTGRNRE